MGRARIRTSNVAMTGDQLADLLQKIDAPPPMSVPVRLDPGEQCYGHDPVDVQVYEEGDGTYVHKSNWGLSPFGVAVGVATMAGNRRRKKKAGLEATTQWRDVGTGELYVTNRRIMIRMPSEWVMVGLDDIMVISEGRDAIEIERNGGSPLRFSMPNVGYYFVLMYRLAFNQIVRPPGA